jgi:serine/threonine-protein kinase
MRKVNQQTLTPVPQGTPQASVATTPEYCDSLVGAKVGNYEVKCLLGFGGMGKVFLAEHPQIGRRVAIKVLEANLSTNQQVANRFLTEARSIARINHPNVVDIFDFGQLKDGRLYYVMEALDGQELRRAVADKGTLAPREVWTYLKPICSGLQAAHDKGIIHRDLKPSNIYVGHGEEPQVRILDFGLAKLLESCDEPSDRTQSGIVMGTPYYLAPEQAAGEGDRICPQTDIYALGVILYWMLSGQKPFSAPSVSELLRKHIGARPPDIRQLNGSLPEAVAALVHRCLEKDPHERPASATALAEEFLSAIQADVPIGDYPTGPQRRSIAPDREITAALMTGPGLLVAEARRPGRVGTIIGLAAAALVIAAAIAYWQLGGAERSPRLSEDARSVRGPATPQTDQAGRSSRIAEQPSGDPRVGVDASVPVVAEAAKVDATASRSPSLPPPSLSNATDPQPAMAPKLGQTARPRKRGRPRKVVESTAPSSSKGAAAVTAPPTKKATQPRKLGEGTVGVEF